MNFRSSKFALLLGAINGAICGTVFQPALTAFFEMEQYRAWQSNINLFTPKINTFGLSILCAILFALASYTVHKFWSKRVNSTIVLWQLVAIVAIAVPSLCLYSIEKLGYLFGAIQAKFERGQWGYFPGIMPDGNDVEFAVLLLCLAISVNFFFGVVLEKLNERFIKQ